MIIKTFLTGWILAIVSVYAHSPTSAGFCSVSSCNLLNAPVIPDVILGVSPESVVYLKLGPDQIESAEFAVERDVLKNVGAALSVRYIDCMRLKDQLSVSEALSPSCES